MKIKKDIKFPSINYSLSCSMHEPDECPNCHYALKPSELNFSQYTDGSEFYSCTTYLCKKCYQPFIVWHKLYLKTEYSSKKHYAQANLLSVGPSKFASKQFSSEISNISPRFIQVYNEAHAAEQYSLMEICGAGYRKALEILIKDYLTTKDPDNADKYKSSSLSQCINSSLIHEYIKTTASRAAWFGNDQTHYEKKFEDKDISDLKTAIEATQYWICMETITGNLSKVKPAK